MTFSDASVTTASSDLGTMARPWAVAGRLASTKSRGVGEADDGAYDTATAIWSPITGSSNQMMPTDCGTMVSICERPSFDFAWPGCRKRCGRVAVGARRTVHTELLASAETVSPFGI